ncbi:MAG: TetR/AcrR family transcriptional regulator, partial [Paludibacter sp.]
MSKKMTNTKKMLIEVARELFALHGKKEVTMNDIAEASKKGRRTLYTYFT